MILDSLTEEKLSYHRFMKPFSLSDMMNRGDKKERETGLGFREPVIAKFFLSTSQMHY